MRQFFIDYGNVIIIFVLPLLLGLILRIALFKVKIARFMTPILLFLSSLLYIIVSNINTHGSEGPILRVVMLFSFSVGSLISEIVLLFKSKFPRR